MSIVQRLTEGIVNRDLSAEGAALINKWEQTGLLEGISDDTQRNGMARLLENQAKELLRESSSMAAGDVEGFAAVAFPLVRRVFGSLIANDLVSVQPMSLPSGLIFFLDFKYGGVFDNTEDRLGNVFDTSLYGGGRVGSEITGGVLLDGVNAERGPYALNNGYSSPTGSVTGLSITTQASGNVGANGEFEFGASPSAASTYELVDLLEFDPDLVSGSAIAVTSIAKTALPQFNLDDFVAITVAEGAAGDLADGRLVRRLTREDPTNEDNILLIVNASGSETRDALSTALAAVTDATFPIDDDFIASAGAIGAVDGRS